MGDITWTVDGIFALFGIASAFVAFVCFSIFAMVASGFDYLCGVCRKVKSKLNKEVPDEYS